MPLTTNRHYSFSFLLLRLSISLSLSPSLSIHFLSSTTARAGFLSYRSRNDRVPFSLPPSRRFHATKEYSSSSSSSSCTMVFHRKRSLVSDMEIYFHTIGTSFSFSVPSPPSGSRGTGGETRTFIVRIRSCHADTIFLYERSFSPFLSFILRIFQRQREISLFLFRFSGHFTSV